MAARNDQRKAMDRANENTSARPTAPQSPILVHQRRRAPDAAEAQLPPPRIRVRAQMSLRRLLLRRSVVATVVAIAALVVSYHYGGLLGSAKHQHLHQLLALCGAVVFLVAAVSAVRSGTSDVVGFVHVPGRLGDARASTLRLLCLLA